MRNDLSTPCLRLSYETWERNYEKNEQPVSNIIKSFKKSKAKCVSETVSEMHLNFAVLALTSKFTTF